MTPNPAGDLGQSARRTRGHSRVPGRTRHGSRPRGHDFFPGTCSPPVPPRPLSCVLQQGQFHIANATVDSSRISAFSDIGRPRSCAHARFGPLHRCSQGDVASALRSDTPTHDCKRNGGRWSSPGAAPTTSAPASGPGALCLRLERRQDDGQWLTKTKSPPCSSCCSSPSRQRPPPAFRPW
jgi:hypothetical protein